MKNPKCPYVYSNNAEPPEHIGKRGLVPTKFWKKSDLFQTGDQIMHKKLSPPRFLTFRRLYNVTPLRRLLTVLFMADFMTFFSITWVIGPVKSKSEQLLISLDP